MIETKTAKKDFVKMTHTQKLTKVKKILSLLAKKSPFFADLDEHFKQQKDIQENALDAMYSMVMNLVYQQNK